MTTGRINQVTIRVPKRAPADCHPRAACPGSRRVRPIGPSCKTSRTDHQAERPRRAGVASRRRPGRVDAKQSRRCTTLTHQSLACETVQPKTTVQFGGRTDRKTAHSPRRPKRVPCSAGRAVPTPEERSTHVAPRTKAQLEGVSFELRRLPRILRQSRLPNTLKRLPHM